MSKKENLDPDSNSFCFEIAGSTISADKYQYIVNGFVDVPGKNAKGEKRRMPVTGYFSYLADAIQEVRDSHIKALMFNSKTIEEAIDRMIKVDDEFKKLLEPLAKFEKTNVAKNI